MYEALKLNARCKLLDGRYNVNSAINILLSFDDELKNHYMDKMNDLIKEIMEVAKID